MSIYKNKKIIVLFLAPVTIGLLVFVYYPLIQTIIGSLYKWVSYSPDRKWVGIANYLAIFQKKGFLRILFNNTIYAILSVVCQVGLAMVMAACLPIGIVGLVSAIHQGKTAVASIGIVAKKPDQFGKAMLFPAMVETYAILALLVSFLAVNGIPV